MQKKKKVKKFYYFFLDEKNATTKFCNEKGERKEKEKRATFVINSRD